jgi:predicted O-methyltransferase YrrM
MVMARAFVLKSCINSHRPGRYQIRSNLSILNIQKRHNLFICPFVIQRSLSSLSNMAAEQSWNQITEFSFQNDPVWTAVDQYNWSHLHSKGTNPSPELLEKILQSTKEAGLPPISVSPAQGKFLQIQSRLLQAKNILEVGLLGGYSTIFLATSGSDVKVTSLEIDPNSIAVSKKHFDWAGVSDKIEVIEGAAMDTFPSLVQEVKDGKKPKFDFIFIDANKENNLDYFNYALEMSHVGTCIIIDNVVRRGRVVSETEAQKDTAVAGTRRAIDGVGKNPRVDATILQLVGEKNYDGFLVSVVKE